MKKVFKVAHIKDLEKQIIKGEISYSRGVEIMNEMANEAFQNWVTPDKMPDYDGLYLCYIKQPQECENIWEYQKVVNCHFNSWQLLPNEEVIYWMQLPEAPN